MIQAVMLGSGGSRPVPNRFLSSLYCSVSGVGVLFDCGESTQTAIMKARSKIMSISVICLTHSHADHILGLPGLLASIDQSIKLDSKHNSKMIFIVAPESCRNPVNNLKRAAFLSNIEIVFICLENAEEVLEFPGFIIEAYRVKHSIDCYGYSITEKVNPHFSIEKAQACGLPEKAWKFLQEGYTVADGDEIFTIKDITDKPRKSAKVAYVTDTLRCDAVGKCVKGSDLAVLEGMYYNNDGLSKSVDSMHMTFEQASQIACESEVKELWLTHFNPSILNPKRGLAYATKHFRNTKCGYTGLKMELRI